MTLLALPAGMTPDKSADWGLLGFMNNANVAADERTPITTAGTNTNLTAAQFMGNAIILAAGASGGFTITMPSTASILAAMGQSIPSDGTFSMVLRIKNDGVGQTGTLTVGDASTTLNGTMTIATNTTRSFLVTVATPTTLVIDNLGSMAL
jgi:hypothetical protein